VTMAMCAYVCVYRSSAAVEADLVGHMPDYPPEAQPPQRPFKTYSGFLNVTVPEGEDVGGYDQWVIHYQLEMVQGGGKAGVTPLTAWHTGGPGGSSIYGLYGEAGYFLVSDSGQSVNQYAWNRVSHMLYLESPAGSYLSPDAMNSGFSYCVSKGIRQKKCSWNDRTQAKAYGHTLKAFFAAYPELDSAPFYLAGESYAGQYIPNIAKELLARKDFAGKLKGIAVGNGCWGGNESSSECNGPNEQRDVVDLYYGKGLISKKLYQDTQRVCAFANLPFTTPQPPEPASDSPCGNMLTAVDTAVGPHNYYNVYDNCHELSLWLAHSGRSHQWLQRHIRKNLWNPELGTDLNEMGGGYDWSCGQFQKLPAYLGRADVRRALHMPEQAGSVFDYANTGPGSRTLYPELIKSGIRVLIYNGDADTAVPYNGNEEWTTGMEATGVATVKRASHPWYLSSGTSVPSGSATTYVAPNSTNEFAFVTIRLAGHEVPHYAPEQAFVMFSNFVEGKEW